MKPIITLVECIAVPVNSKYPHRYAVGSKYTVVGDLIMGHDGEFLSTCEITIGKWFKYVPNNTYNKLMSL